MSQGWDESYSLPAQNLARRGPGDLNKHLNLCKSGHRNDDVHITLTVGHITLSVVDNGLKWEKWTGIEKGAIKWVIDRHGEAWLKQGQEAQLGVWRGEYNGLWDLLQYPTKVGELGKCVTLQEAGAALRNYIAHRPIWITTIA